MHMILGTKTTAARKKFPVAKLFPTMYNMSANQAYTFGHMQTGFLLYQKPVFFMLIHVLNDTLCDFSVYGSTHFTTSKSSLNSIYLNIKLFDDYN